MNPSIPVTIKLVVFTPYERNGVVIMAVAGVSSCVLVSTLLLFIIFTAVSPWPKRQPGSPPPFTSKQIAVFIICLLSSDLLQSIAGVTQMKWAIENRIYEGHACSVQAAALVVGDLGSTLWSCVIAAHTFSALALGKYWPRWVVYVTVITGWSFVILLTVLPPALHDHTKGPFFSIAGTWCFISSNYAIARLGIHYIPLFFAAIVLFVFYTLVFFVLRGNISFRGSGVQSTPRRAEDLFLRDRIIIAKRMLWYPFAYLTCVLPIAIIRLVGLRNVNVPESVWIFAMFFLFSLGVVDSVIYTTTRKLIKPLSFPTHMRTFSDNSNNNIKGNGIVSRDPSAVKKFSTYSESPTYTSKITGSSDDEFRDYSDTPKKQEPHLNPGAIHVTLEREEVII